MARGGKGVALSIKGAGDLLLRTPTALFPIALGLSGFGAGLRAVASAHGMPWLGHIGAGILVAAGMVLVIDLVFYSVKLLRDRQAVAVDFAMASKANLLAPGFMAAMVIGGQAAAVSPLGGPLWLAATLGHLMLLISFVGRWLTRDYGAGELNPTWFLPAAGIMTSALSWPGYGPTALPLFTLASGAMLWVLLLPLVFRRLVFEPAIDPKLRPSLFILAAPFGLAAGGLMTLFPAIPTLIPAALLCGGAFFILVLVTQVRFLAEAGVTLGWWATTFPVATVAAGFLRLPAMELAEARWIGTGLMGLATLTTSIALIASLRSAGRTCWRTSHMTQDDIAAMQGIQAE